MRLKKPYKPYKLINLINLRFIRFIRFISTNFIYKFYKARGAISFYYKLKPDYVPCVEITIGDKKLFSILTALFVGCRIVHNKRLKFEGQTSVVELLDYLEKYPLKSN